MNESALMKQFKDTVTMKDIEIAKLQNDNETLKLELTKIKNHSQRLPLTEPNTHLFVYLSRGS